MRIGLKSDGYLLKNDQRLTYVLAHSDQGLLYGIFYLIEQLQRGVQKEHLSVNQNPATPIRMLNHWDNIDGTIERGYAGRSIFFDQNECSYDFKRIQQYADLLASVGVNKISINNVNVHREETMLITKEKLEELKELANLFRENYISMYLSINYASPMEVGNYKQRTHWTMMLYVGGRNKQKQSIKRFLDFGGFIVKADSEHRPGPFTYGRTHADGANMLAKALLSYGGRCSGVVLYMIAYKIGGIEQRIELELLMITFIN